MSSYGLNLSSCMDLGFSVSDSTLAIHAEDMDSNSKFFCPIAIAS